MWTRHTGMSIGKVMFFLNRYVPFMTTSVGVYATFTPTSKLDTDICHNTYIVISCLIYFDFFLAHVILLIRAYAVWKPQRLVQIILANIYLMVVVGSLYVQYRFFRGVTRLHNSCKFSRVEVLMAILALQSSQLPLIGIRRGCLFTFKNDLVWINCVVILAVETLAIGLLVAKAIVMQRQFHLTNGLLEIMVRDGVVYYLCTFALSIANLVVLRGTSGSVRDGLLPTQAVLQSILCNRLLFHVHVVNEERTRSWSSEVEHTPVLVELRQVPTQTHRKHSATIK